MVAEASLGLLGYSGEGCGVGLPCGDAAVVFTAVFVVDDEGIDAIAQAFFDHEHSGSTAIFVFDGVNCFEAGDKARNSYYHHDIIEGHTSV